MAVQTRRAGLQDPPRIRRQTAFLEVSLTPRGRRLARQMCMNPYAHYYYYTSGGGTEGVLHHFHGTTEHTERILGEHDPVPEFQVLH